jgi:putative hydrolase of the HAD superfamily
MSISVVGLDADDTLWHSESHFAITEDRFRQLLEPWITGDDVSARLLARERSNLEIFGYGPKGFTLSMIETAIEVTGDDLPASALQELIDWGKELSSHPVELLDGVVDTIGALGDRYRLFLITKGDLFHQESKVAESGIADHFDRIEVLSEKSPDSYRRVLEAAEVEPDEFVMVGNSVRSDVLPVVEIGARAIHIPYDITWSHELVEPDTCDVTWRQLSTFADLPAALTTL